MKPPESTAVTAGALGPAVTATKPLVEALRAFYRALQRTSMYPEGHPSIPKALQEATDNLSAAVGRSPVRVSVGASSLLVGDGILEEPSGALVSLARLLHGLDVAAIEFSGGTSAEHLGKLVGTLAHARTEGLQGVPLEERIRQASVPGVRLVALDYGAFRIAEGAREPGAGGAESWDRMMAQLTADDMSPAQLAEKVNCAIEQSEGTGVRALRTKIRQIHSRLSGMQPAQRNELRRRVSEFVSALNAELRSDLMRLDRSNLAESTDLLTELAELIPDPDLIDALREIDQAGARVPHQLLTLMNKLVRISGERPGIAAGLRETLDSWGLPPSMLDEDTPDLQAALVEVFQQRREVNCNPDSYQELLDELSRRELEAADASVEVRYRDPRDSADLEVHAAEVAALLLGRRDGERYRPSLLGYVHTASDSLIQERRFAALRDVAISAKTFTALPNETGPTRQAATRFLEGFTDTARIGQLLERACEGARFPVEATNLLGLGGDAAIDRALDFLDGERRFEIAEALRRFVQDAGPDKLREVAEQRFAGGWSQLRPVLDVLRRTPLAHCIPQLKRLYEHEDWRVRREVISVLAERAARTPGAETLLRLGLVDDPRVAAVAVSLLSDRGDDRAIALLGGCLKSHQPPAAETAQRAVRALMQVGPRGIGILCGCLRGLGFRVTPRWLDVGVEIAEALRPLGPMAGVSQTLFLWRCSPAHLAAVLLGRRPKRRS